MFDLRERFLFSNSKFSDEAKRNGRKIPLSSKEDNNGAVLSSFAAQSDAVKKIQDETISDATLWRNMVSDTSSFGTHVFDSEDG